MRKGQEYNSTLIEKKWQRIWEQKKIFSPDLDRTKKPFYNLMMFPYPSAEGLHVGNMYAFTGSDIYGRFKRMQGFSVFEPIGLDGFGIHSENYALKVGRHPLEQAKISEKNFYRQLRATGNTYDWSRTLETYDPDYYKWTQWIFIQLFKAGLAYRKKAPVNFCPSCLTVLADEQVINGQCERCSSIVEKRELEQWFFKITAYADRLLDGLNQIDWSEKVKIAQRNWIGKKEGTLIKFLSDGGGIGERYIEVFTTRPDTLYGATFIVLAPEHPISTSIKSKEVQDYIKRVKKKTEQERLAEGKEKTGVFSGLYAINPLNEEKIPVWIADYAVMGYGTGALFGDAHDGRDVEFAKKYGIPLKPTIMTGDGEKDARIKNLEECYTGEGMLFDSGEFSGLTSAEAKKEIVAWLVKKGKGKAEITYHLRDWLISRQRYWGPPIPMIYCSKCGVVPVPEEDLPVELPYIEDFKPKGTGTSPLAQCKDWSSVACPECGTAARRETDVSDTFLDSSWYFFRYLATDVKDTPLHRERVRKWLPVDMYIGGAEHSVLHLMYARFMTMVFKDLRLIEFEEPFKKFYAHGLLISEGAKMSKSRGNVIIPDAYIQKYGADTLRCYLMFLGPFSQGGDFRDTGIEGMGRFLKRIWSLVIGHLSLAKDQRPKAKDQSRIMHKTVKKVTEDIENLRYNTAIAKLMEYVNYLQKQSAVASEELKVLLLLLAPFAPHMTEELWQRIEESSIHLQSWPKYDPKMLEEEEVTIVVQVNGKVRDSIKYSALSIKNKEEVEKRARQSDRLKKYLDNKNVKKVIYVPGKIINFVVED